MRLALVLVVVLAGNASADPRKLHAQSIIVDTHIDTPSVLADQWSDLGKRKTTDHFDFPRAKEGGLSAAFFSIYVDSAYANRGATRRAHELIDLTLRVIDENPKDAVLATSVADIRAAKKGGKFAVLMGIEGGHAIEDSMAVLRGMYRAGVRYMTLTHTNTNHWADSSGPAVDPAANRKALRVHGGLSDYGTQVVKEMNRLGMIVDISHVSDETVDDVLAVTRAPVMASHSACRALTKMPRNLTDDQIKRIGAGGGIVMIPVGAFFIDQNVVDWFDNRGKQIKSEWTALKAKHKNDPGKRWTEQQALWMKAGAPPGAQWTKVVDHIEHVISIAGEDAVGIGSDFDGIPNPPIGLEDVSKLPKLTEELLKRGHSEARVKKILGENFLAYFARVEAVKASLAKEPPSTADYKAK